MFGKKKKKRLQITIQGHSSLSINDTNCCFANLLSIDVAVVVMTLVDWVLFQGDQHAIGQSHVKEQGCGNDTRCNDKP